MDNLPRNITLHLTENCNLRCKMCYFWGDSGCYSIKNSKSQPKTLDFNLVKTLIRDLTPTKPWYSLFGGEPLLYPHFKDLVKEIKKGGSFVDTPTNGTLISKNAEMLVSEGFDSIRVSLDGPKNVNDKQRGIGSYERAIAGIEILYDEKKRKRSKTPNISIIYTVTPANFDTIEEFFLHDLNLDYIDWITIQMQNFLTQEMGDSYAKLLKSEFGLVSDYYWQSLVRNIDEFDSIDIFELTEQVNVVREILSEKQKNILLLPPTFSPENLKAYLKADWKGMQDQFTTCYSPFVSADIVANGDVAPCHIFYDLVMGNLHKNSISEIWNSPRYIKFKNMMKQHPFMPICSGCCILYLSGKKARKRKEKT